MASKRTWRTVRVCLGEGHFGLEEGAVVDRVGVGDDKGDVPFEDTLVDKLP